MKLFHIDNIIRAYLIGIYLIVPAFFLPFADDITLVPRFLLLSVLFLVFLIYGLKNKLFDKLYLDKISALIALFFIVNLISVFWAVNKAEAIFDIQKIFLALLIYILTINLLHTFKDFENIFIKLSITYSLVITFVAFYQIFSYQGNLFEDVQKYYSIRSLNSHKNLFSSMALILLFINLTGLFKLNNIWKSLSIISSTLITFLILFLQTRAVILSLLVCLILFVVLYFVRFKEIIRKKIFYISISSIILIFSISTIITTVKIDSSQLSKRYDISKFTSTGSGNERMFIWYNTINIIKSNWLFGVGAGNWKIMFPEYVTNYFNRDIPDYLVFTRPHNDFLWILSETGFIGLIIYISIFLIILYKSLKYILNKEKDSLEVVFYFLLLAGLLVNSCFCFPRERIEHAIFFYSILAIINYKIKITESVIPINLKAAAKTMTYFLVILFLMLNIIIGYQRLTGEYFTKEIFKYRFERNWDKVIEYSDKASSFFYNCDMTIIPITWYKGNAEFMLKRYKQAMLDYEKAYDANPNNMHIINNLASAYEMNGFHNEAMKKYLKVIRINDKFEDAKFNLSLIYLNQGKFDMALNLLSRIQSDTIRKNYYINVIKNIEGSK